MQEFEGKKILIVKWSNNAFENFFSEQMKCHGVDVIEPIDLRTIRPNQKVRNLLRNLKAMAFGVKGVNLQAYDLIISFEDVRGIPILWWQKRKDARLILWNWNTLTPKMAARENHVAALCEIWTFDPGDAVKYQWRLNHAFFLPVKEIPKQTSAWKNVTTAFCVCVDKGRYGVIKQIKKVLEEKGVYCDFWVVKDNSSEYAEQDSSWLHEQGLPYPEVLQKIWKSDIIVDVVQRGQKGITMRPLEALYYGKKLITTHKEIVDSVLYDPRNVFVIGEENENRLELFLTQKQVCCNKAALGAYSFEDWLKTFLHSQENNHR